MFEDTINNGCDCRYNYAYDYECVRLLLVSVPGYDWMAMDDGTNLRLSTDCQLTLTVCYALLTVCYTLLTVCCNLSLIPFDGYV